MPLDVPGCTRATMIIAVSILKSSCANKLYVQSKYLLNQYNIITKW